MNTQPTQQLTGRNSGPFFSTTPSNIMTFTTHNTNPTVCNQANGTSLQGYVDATYKELTGLFGQPTESDGYKVDAEWYISFDDGTFATIYNYKNGKNYCGEAGLPVEQIKNWHIGGESKKSCDRVQIALDLYRETRAESEAPKDGPAKALADAVETRESIIDSLIAHKGEKYKEAVIAGVCAIKLSELNALVLSMLSDHGMPKGIGKALRNAHGQMVAQMLGSAARNAGISGDDKQIVDEMMEWADKINKVEQGAAKKIVDFIGKEDE